MTQGTIHEIAYAILDMFEDLLESHDITLPSDERTGEEGEARLYGDDYYVLEDRIIALLSEEISN